MKKTYIFSPVIMGLGALLWVSASGGVAQNQKKDRTGSPISDVSCTQCHLATGNFDTSARLKMTNSSGVEVTTYKSGESYTLEVIIQSARNIGHGFQVTGMFDDNTSAGTCSSRSSNTQITPLNGRWYFEQNGIVNSGQYAMTWNAPSVGSGKVTFYGVVLSTDGNGLTTGDEFFDLPNLVMEEDITNGILEDLETELRVYPNPAHQTVMVSSTFNAEKIEVYDFSGRAVLSTDATGNQNELNVSGFSSGIYFIEVYSSHGLEKSMFLKK